LEEVIPISCALFGWNRFGRCIMKTRSVLPTSIKGRLIFYFGITVTLVVLFIVAAFSRSMYRTLINENDQLIKAHTREIANKIEEQNLEAVSVAKAMALAQKSGLFGNREASIRYARNILLAYPRFTGAYFAYEPYLYEGKMIVEQTFPLRLTANLWGLPVWIAP